MALNQSCSPENLKEQLSLAVRSIQWSYAIFWSISATQPGVLEWGNGYYNGDIKTRKTIQAVEFNPEELGLQRSEQLRELYDSLSAGESSPHSKRPCAALSPEDLSDTEWYYLVCMSFVFDIGPGLPGRTLATGKPVWLCNAYHADSKVFSRSLLAKSASIRTIVCFPFLGGVIELGTTELVLEDPGLVQRIKDSYLEIPYAMKPDPDTHQTSNEELLYNDNIDLVPVLHGLDMASPNISSTDLAPDDLPEDSFIIEGMNDVASQVFVDDDFGHSMNSGDCISQTFTEPGKSGVVISKEELTKADLINDDLFYKSVISSLVKSQDRLVSGPRSRGGKHGSSFVSWKKKKKKKGGLPNVEKASASQKLLKRILFGVPKMHGNGAVLESPKDDAERDTAWRPNVEEIEGTPSGNMQERFRMLNSILPLVNKLDEVSVLDNTIGYLKELKRRVDELELGRVELTELSTKSQKKPIESSEQTSDNYESVDKTPTRTKRKIRDHDETSSLAVSVSGKVVQIDVRCIWREGLLLEIVEALRSLRLDSHTVQSSTVDGVLFLSLKCKFSGSPIGSAGLIRQKLERVVQRS